MNQANYQLNLVGMSQCDRVLQCLREAAGKWVAMPDLVLASDSFNIHSRVSDLRKRGHLIEQSEERDGRRIKSFYRIIE